MKAKTLLVAAAALAAATISSQAQVYSQNVVGYVNISLPAGAFSLIANPLDNGTNTANDLLGSLPNKSQIQLWNGSGFTIYAKTSNGFTSNSIPVSPSIPVGSGFFVKSASAFTNTFVGTVIPVVGGQSTNSLPAGLFRLVGSTIPVGGGFNDVGSNTLNLVATLPNKSQVQVWTGSGFVIYAKTSAGFTSNSVPVNPPYNVGQGFFVKSASATNWVQSLQP